MAPTLIIIVLNLLSDRLYSIAQWKHPSLFQGFSGVKREPCRPSWEWAVSTTCGGDGSDSALQGGFPIFRSI